MCSRAIRPLVQMNMATMAVLATAMPMSQPTEARDRGGSAIQRSRQATTRGLASARTGAAMNRDCNRAPIHQPSQSAKVSSGPKARVWAQMNEPLEPASAAPAEKATYQKKEAGVRRSKRRGAAR